MDVVSFFYYSHQIWEDEEEKMSIKSEFIIFLLSFDDIRMNKSRPSFSYWVVPRHLFDWCLRIDVPRAIDIVFNVQNFVHFHWAHKEQTFVWTLSDLTTRVDHELEARKKHTITQCMESIKSVYVCVLLLQRTEAWLTIEKWTNKKTICKRLNSSKQNYFNCKCTTLFSQFNIIFDEFSLKERENGRTNAVNIHSLQILLEKWLHFTENFIIQWFLRSFQNEIIRKNMRKSEKMRTSISIHIFMHCWYDAHFCFNEKFTTSKSFIEIV